MSKFSTAKAALRKSIKDTLQAEIEAAKNKAAIKAAKSKATKARASIDSDAREVVGSTERSGAGGNAERDIEEGKGGKVNSGRAAVVSFYDLERSNPVRRAEANRVVTLEAKERKGTITKKEEIELEKLNADSKKTDVNKSRSAASTASSNARAGRGISLADGMDGEKVTVGKVVKQPSGEMIGDTKNGINKATGEIFGNPTPNQLDMAVRDVKARKGLSEAARNERLAKLAKARGRTKQQRQSAAIANMERNMVDTGPDKSGRKKGGLIKKKKPTNNYAYGGMTTSKPRTGNTDYRMGGMFMKKGKK